MNARIFRVVWSSLPRGLIGMIVLVGVVESFLTRQEIHFSNANVANWRYAAEGARDVAREAEILCLGTSLTKDGILPLVVEEQLGRPTGNLAVFGGPIAASYYVLKHALKSGARPRVVLLDRQDTPDAGGASQDPFANLWTHIRQWPEILSFGECLDLAWSAGDARLFGVLAVSRALPSSRARVEIRTSILSALQGRSGSSLCTIAAVQRNWRINKGAHVMAELPDPSPLPIAQPGSSHPGRVGRDPRAWRRDPFCELYTQRLLDLTILHGIEVFWLLPPVGPEMQAYRANTGLEDYFGQLARSVQSRYPNVVVVDGRDSGYPRRAFGDPYHLSRRGAVAYSRGLATLIGNRLADPSSLPRWVSLPEYQDMTSEVPIEDIDQSRMAILERMRAARNGTRR